MYTHSPCLTLRACVFRTLECEAFNTSSSVTRYIVNLCTKNRGCGHVCTRTDLVRQLSRNRSHAPVCVHAHNAVFMDRLHSVALCVNTPTSFQTNTQQVTEVSGSWCDSITVIFLTCVGVSLCLLSAGTQVY